MVLTVNLILGYLLFLLVSPYGNIRLGGPDASPEFSRAAWLAMLFSAGMRIGLMFYSVAEPMYHLANPPHGAAPDSEAACEDAIKTTFLHWGLKEDCRRPGLRGSPEWAAAGSLAPAPPSESARLRPP